MHHPRPGTAPDPETHQTKKGNQWYFGMKARLGADSRTKLIHTVAIGANVADSLVLPQLLHAERLGGGATRRPNYAGTCPMADQRRSQPVRRLQIPAGQQRTTSFVLSAPPAEQRCKLINQRRVSETTAKSHPEALDKGVG
jgi:hypothetical protein